jgi:hypothetical protein
MRTVAVLAVVAVLTVPHPAQGQDDGERQAVVDAHEAALQAQRDSLQPPNPQHPAIAETHTHAAYDGWVSWVESARSDPADAFVFAPPLEHEVLTVDIEEIDGAQVAWVMDCQLTQGETRTGTGFEPSPNPASGNTQLAADIMTRDDGTWKLGLFLSVTVAERGTLGCMAD